MNNATCVRVDHEEFVGDVVQEIKQCIHACSALICDLSLSRPNVLYEAGYAQALERPVVFICSTPLDQLPLNVRNENTLHYSVGQTSALREPLRHRLHAALSLS